MSFQTPSLASATSTRLDSACKHIQQCRISYDNMLDFVENAQDLERNKMQYCVHKDEMIVGVGRPWRRDKALRGMNVSAYPRIVSNLGDITKPAFDTHRKIILYVYHFATSLQKRNEIIEQMNSARAHSIPKHANVPQHYLSDASGNNLDLTKLLAKMYDFYPVGFSNTLGYVHPNSGDTMSSVMIGGLRTVMNGDFEVFAGDEIQWYWTFEANCFHPDGRRKSIVNATNEVMDGGNPENDYSGEVDRPKGPLEPRRIYNDYQYGATESRLPSDKSKSVARIKPYFRDEKQPRVYDWMRVFAIAISSARPNEMVDIKICRQSM